jgi:hypothetical protein
MTATAPPATEPVDRRPAYPLPAPAADPRFTYGLVLDVADVLTAHGYPPPQSSDWAELMSAVFGFLYQPEQQTPIRQQIPIRQETPTR